MVGGGYVCTAVAEDNNLVNGVETRVRKARTISKPGLEIDIWPGSIKARNKIPNR